MKTVEKDKIYNAVALKQYELEELKQIRTDLITMNENYKAEMTIKTIQSKISGVLYKKKVKIIVVPELLIQIVDKLIESKREYLDKAINLAVISKNKEREEE